MTTPKTPAKAPAKKRGLGRGLEALLGPKAAAEAPPSLEATEADTLRTLPVDALTAGKYQPRKHWDADKLTELAESIKAQGVIQPIVVRERPDRTYEIIAGERRWRASKQAGLADVPVVVRNVEDRTVVAMALIENIQREDLNPLEEAQALQRLIDEFDLTHAQAAEAVGRSRAAVSNLLRLLELPPAIRVLVESKQLEMGHARALLGLPLERQVEGARHVVARGLTVRQTEALVRQWLASGEKPKSSSKADPDIARLEQKLAERLGSPVQIRHGQKGKGQLVIRYSSLDELQGVLAHIR